jgi:hypothetical protein
MSPQEEYDAACALFNFTEDVRFISDAMERERLGLSRPNPPPAKAPVIPNK